MSEAAASGGSHTNGRRAARRLAIQALYQWDLTADNVGDIVTQCIEREPGRMEVDFDFFEQTVRGVAGAVTSLDAQYEKCLDRPVDQLDPIERAVLRTGTWEFINRLDVPYRVVINESVELAKMFGAEEGHKYINGVLDKLAKHLRAAETRKGRT